ncbi:hypothetical protein PPL_04045 [Heterostelium album PN500]|uniref:Transmembrane protein n=1 Tax=Heterostelium pallidum (strain ATCC 26659 / Pp 5 / PN500) TaxID=670386 RepID=D3B5V7_HETP5|nr:hypothetical protein PPL_04045 [Heterostelium album PN500]EFA83255.1 hypothetical protein PPL_04045 [Heterostelium album PN500]|eukprot:XP_020435372.1 hypothetical protein PPL_04045 [Heterostelium album PN500]
MSFLKRLIQNNNNSNSSSILKQTFLNFTNNNKRSLSSFNLSQSTITTTTTKLNINISNNRYSSFLLNRNSLYNNKNVYDLKVGSIRMYSNDNKNDKRRFAIPVESKEEAKRLYFSYVLMFLATCGLYFYLYTEYLQYTKRKEIAQQLSEMSKEEIEQMLVLGRATEILKDQIKQEQLQQQKEEEQQSANTSSNKST